MKELGKIFQEERNKRDWSLARLKIKIESFLPYKKVNINDISLIERGLRKDPNPLLISKICRAFGMDDVSILRKFGFLCKDTEEITELYSNSIYIDIYANITDAITAPKEGIKEKDKYLLTDKKIIKNSYNLVGTFIAEEEVPTELENFKWILINKGEKIGDKDLGVFLYKEKYVIRKKRISIEGKIILIGKNEEIVVIEGKNRYEEIGKIISGLKNF